MAITMGTWRSLKAELQLELVINLSYFQRNARSAIVNDTVPHAARSNSGCHSAISDSPSSITPRSALMSRRKR